MIKRYLEHAAFLPEYGRQMRFIAGPRQSGKTTIARNKLEKEGTPGLYYNWDSRLLRKRYRDETDIIENDILPIKQGKKVWVCFDEIHKMPKWKNMLKDFFDTHEDRVNFIVTGSARLDVMRRAGDSLAGRYFMFRLNPLMAAEAAGREYGHVMPEAAAGKTIEKLISNSREEEGIIDGFMNKSCFPEPFLAPNAASSAKWHDNYFELLAKEELRDISAIRDLETVSTLLHLLPARVGAPLSLESLRQDLEINHATVKNYMNYLGLTYAVFTLQPFFNNVKRAVKKEKKAYFYDYYFIDNKGYRFENLVALELKSRVDLWNDSAADRYELCYVRNRDRKETDFLVTKNKKPYFHCEAKFSEENIENHHKINSAALGDIPFVQIIRKKGVIKADGKGFYVVSAGRLFA
jgi:predicted AAA+ superfamily ATPase